jgi:hypothetical protein
MTDDLDRLRDALAEYRAADEAAHRTLMSEKFDHAKYEDAIMERAIAARVMANAAEWVTTAVVSSPRYELVDEADAYVNEDAADHDDWDIEPWPVEPYPEEEDAFWGYARD